MLNLIKKYCLNQLFISCIPDKDIYVFYLDGQFLSHPCYLTQDRSLIKWYARKSIYYGCMVWIEKSVTRDHCSASLGKPRDADQ